MLIFSGDISLYRELPFQCSHFSSDGTYQHTDCECPLQCLVMKKSNSFFSTRHIRNNIYTSACVQSATVKVVQHSVEFEEALAVLVMMTAPMAPHLASELWAGW